MRQTMHPTALGAAFLALTGVPAFAQTAATPPATTPAPETPGATPTPPATTPPTTPAPAAAPATNYGIQTSGLIDGYYLYNFNNPKDTANAGLAYYDVRDNSPALSLAELNVFQTPKPNGFGWKTTLIAGDTADINHGVYGTGNTTLGEARWKNVQQLYGTFSSKSGAGIDFGKYYTPFGYEVTESNQNFNYSRSLPYALLPIYHFGLRAYTPSMKGLTVTGYLFRALFNTQEAGVQDDNGKLAGAVQLSYSPASGKYTLIENFGAGTDKLGASNVTAGGISTKSILSDTDFTYNLNTDPAKAKIIGLNYVNLQQKPDNINSLRFNGYAVYYKQQLNAKDAFALRYSSYDEKQGGASDFRPYEITGTYEIKAATNFLTRFEYRHDHSNVDPNNIAAYAPGAYNFVDSQSQPDKRDQDTFSVSGVFTF